MAVYPKEVRIEYDPEFLIPAVPPANDVESLASEIEAASEWVAPGVPTPLELVPRPTDDHLPIYLAMRRAAANTNGRMELFIPPFVDLLREVLLSVLPGAIGPVVLTCGPLADADYEVWIDYGQIIIRPRRTGLTPGPSISELLADGVPSHVAFVTCMAYRTTPASAIAALIRQANN